MQGERVICDTGVISRALLATPSFVEVINKQIGLSGVRITPVIRIELFNWLSDFRQLTRPERASLLRLIKEYELLHITEPISKLAVELSDKHINSKPGDTLIAATALYHGLPLYTLNKKDFLPLGVTLYE